MVARPLRVLNRHRFPKHRLPIFTVKNSADNNPVQATHSKSVHTTCMASNQTAAQSPTARHAELHNVKPAQF